MRPVGKHQCCPNTAAVLHKNRGSALLHAPNIAFITQQAFKRCSSLWYYLASVLLIHAAQQTPKYVLLLELFCPMLIKTSTSCLGESKCHSQERASEESHSQATYLTQWLHAHYSSSTGPSQHVKETRPAKTQVTIPGAKW